MKENKVLNFIKKYSYVFIIGLLLVNNYTKALAINIVDGFSMYPTLNDKEIVLGSCFGKIERGDIIVAKKENYFVIKRVIGLPNEIIKGEEGKVYINGTLLEEPYVKNNDTNEWEYRVGEDEFFIAGDNRKNSYDSRNYGPIKKDSVVQKIFLGKGVN